uniref:Centromere/kinetochore protein zw10 homolog n=1 Tax=Ciona savignyi TaxID=51511 RepID=H2ZGU2_CIOSA
MMSSLVSDALASGGKLTKDDLNAKISKLAARTFECKRELYKSIEDNYSNFSSLLVSCKDTNMKLTAVRKDADQLQNSFRSMVKDQIPDTTKEYDKLLREHLKSVELLSVLEKLYSIHTHFNQHNNNLKFKNLHESSMALDKVKQELNSVEGSSMVDIDIYKALKVQYRLSMEQFLYTLDEAWRDSIVWQLPGDKGDMTIQPKLTISFSQDQSLTGQDVIYALHTCGTLVYKVEKLAKLCIEHMLTPLITSMSSDLEITQSESSPCVLLVNGGNSGEDNQDEKVSTPDAIFTKVLKFLQFLHQNLLKLKLSADKEATLMDTFSSFVFEKTTKLIIDNCMSKTVPSSIEELQEYRQAAETVKKFEESLRKINFVPSSVKKTDLMSYVADIHIHFASRRCINILAEARRLMKMDLHDSEEVSENESKGKIQIFALDEPHSSNKAEKQPEYMERGMELLLKPENPLSDDSLSLPRCRVSKSAKSILKLVYTTLCEAAKATDYIAARLLQTTEQIFELYMAMLPVYHKETLLNVPYITAIFHNDCWFLAHHLLTMGHQFSKHLKPNVEGTHHSFVLLVPRLRKIGGEFYLAQLRRQRDQIIECLAPLRNFNSALDSSSDKYSTAERPVKQVLHQLQHLHGVWIGTLPVNILQRSLALLTDTAISELVSSICSMEDISSDDSIQLKTICHLMQDQVPLVFKRDEDRSRDNSGIPWQRELKKWQRLSELSFILDSSMADIVDRWADGKGPLSMAFTVAEVKNLLRALFQNTERRAQAISKIRL